MMTSPTPSPSCLPAANEPVEAVLEAVLSEKEVVEHLLSPQVLAEREAYQYYCAYCQVAGRPALPLKAWREVTRAGNRYVAMLLTQQGQRIPLPYQMGALIVYRRKTNFKRPRVNWKESNRLGSRVYHLNAHSDYYESFVAWQKVSCNFTFNGFFSFRPVRDVSRQMTAVMQKPNGYMTYELKPLPPKTKPKK